MEKLETLKPYEKNAKKHPSSQVKKIADSITVFGFQQPIVVDKENVIIVGHGRYEAAKLLGMTEVPVIHADLSPERAKAYRLADNQLNALSDFDMSLVIEELKGLDDTMVELTGFSKDLLITPEEKDDDVPETPAEPTSKRGDIYQLGKHRVMCGDATSLDDVQKLMGEMKADCIVTDPPYNVDYTGKTKDALKIENDKKEDGAFLQFLTDAFTNMDAVLKPGGVFYIWHADSEGYNFRSACKAIGWTTRQCLIWNKNAMVMGRQDYHWKHEPCLYGWKEGAAHLWATDRKQTTILEFDRPSRSSEHPTMKPVELLAYQIANNTKGEDIVLDLFGGSGSTLISAEKLGRVCHMMELSEAYTDVILKRYEEYTGNKPVKIA